MSFRPLGSGSTEILQDDEVFAQKFEKTGIKSDVKGSEDPGGADLTLNTISELSGKASSFF